MTEKSKGIIFFTDNRIDPKIEREVQTQLLSIGLPIVSASLKRMGFGQNIHLQLKRGYATYFKQIVAALQASTADIIFFCEHDVLYPKSHFDFIPDRDDVFFYNHNWVKVRLPDLLAARWDADQVSGLCADRQLVTEHYTRLLMAYTDETFDRKFEPGSGSNSIPWKSADPLVDIRHGANLTKNKWSLDDFRDKRTAKNFAIVSVPDWAKESVSRMI